MRLGGGVESVLFLKVEMDETCNHRKTPGKKWDGALKQNIFEKKTIAEEEISLNQEINLCVHLIFCHRS